MTLWALISQHDRYLLNNVYTIFSRIDLAPQIVPADQPRVNRIPVEFIFEEIICLSSYIYLYLMIEIVTEPIKLQPCIAIVNIFYCRFYILPETKCHS